MKYNRINEMEEYIAANNSVTLERLCEVFGVSINTVRRDVKTLLDRGTVNKIYGGVAANKKTETLSFFEERIIKQTEEKRRIGAAAAGFVHDGDVIFIDSGTTTVQMLDHLKNRQNVTVITNNLKAIDTLYKSDNLNVIAIGGSLIRKTNSFTGGDSPAGLINYNITKCFMAATGISVSAGLTNSTMAEFEIKRAVIQKSTAVYLLADSTKFGVSALMTFCPLSDVTRIVTDKTPAAEYIDYFNRHNVMLTVV